MDGPADGRGGATTPTQGWFPGTRTFPLPLSTRRDRPSRFRLSPLVFGSHPFKALRTPPRRASSTGGLQRCEIVLRQCRAAGVGVLSRPRLSALAHLPFAILSTGDPARFASYTLSRGLLLSRCNFYACDNEICSEAGGAGFPMSATPYRLVNISSARPFFFDARARVFPLGLASVRPDPSADEVR